MNRTFHKVDGMMNGWLSVIILVVLEIIVVYLVSNMPFFLAALESPIPIGEKIGFLGKFVNVLQDEINKGQLLTFVCALIAPVLYWSIVEFKKAIQAKILNVLAIILLALSVYLHGKGKAFHSFESIDLYWAAIVVWVLYILIYRIPPDKNAYIDTTNQDTNTFVARTKGLGHIHGI